MRYLHLLLFCCLAGAANAQQHDVWHFGTTAINFTSGTAVALPSTGMSSSEASSGICNAGGQLLFYTNGGQSPLNPSISGGVWNANNQLMPNGALGADDAGCQSTTQGTIVVPDPANLGTKRKTTGDFYYILTVDCVESMISSPAEDKGLRYTKVDMSLAGGLGDVTEKGIPIVPFSLGGGYNTSREIVTAMPHANGTDYWILFARKDSLGVVLLTETGFSAPFYQQVVMEPCCPSPANDRIAIGNRVYAFDPATGMLSNPVTLTGTYPCFSPDGQLLYTTEANQLYQYNLTATNIPGSQVIIANGLSGYPKLAPDHRIYFIGTSSANGQALHGRVECPNLPGMDCGYNAAYQLPVYGHAHGNPNYMQTPFYHAAAACSDMNTDSPDATPFIVVAPNPADNTFYCRLPEGTHHTTALLFDVNNRLVASFAVGNNEPVTVDNLSPGTYLLRFPELPGAVPLKLMIAH